MLAAQVAFSLVIGRVEMFTGRKAIMVAAYVISVTIFVFLLMWDTEQFPNFVLYAIACVFGLVKCIWKTESNCKLFVEKILIYCLNLNLV